MTALKLIPARHRTRASVNLLVPRPVLIYRRPHACVHCHLPVCFRRVREHLREGALSRLPASMLKITLKQTLAVFPSRASPALLVIFAGRRTTVHFPLPAPAVMFPASLRGVEDVRYFSVGRFNSDCPVGHSSSDCPVGHSSSDCRVLSGSSAGLSNSLVPNAAFLEGSFAPVSNL
ncbi:MAG: hypothetical protein A4E55_00253 [Pelotomaculum sp. PtaU1.Bin035]|nr:MAG: hypothetical protein A4E55_00253 [Pelotomaculum sp. PtaU1.Bin035]